MSKFKVGDVWLDGRGVRVTIVSLNGDGLNKSLPIVGIPESTGRTRLFDANGVDDIHTPFSLISKVKG